MFSHQLIRHYIYAYCYFSISAHQDKQSKPGFNSSQRLTNTQNWNTEYFFMQYDHVYIAFKFHTQVVYTYIHIVSGKEDAQCKQ